MFNNTYSEMRDYHIMCSDINITEICTHTELNYYFKFAVATAYI
jgi:hypothetical protein